MTQWHPIFAALLRPLVEAYYEVRTELPVGDLPRAADFVLVRRTATRTPPFRGLWRHLTPWSVLEVKGPSVSARLWDLDDLLEVGLGVHRRLNEELMAEKRPRLGRSQVSFWYLARRLGPRFLRDAELVLGTLEPLGPGLWRATPVGRSVFLASSQALPPERDSMPLQLLAHEAGKEREALRRVLLDNLDLWPVYGAWVTMIDQALEQEIHRMARTRSRELKPNWDALIEVYGLDKLVESMGPERLIEAVGPKRVIESIGPQRVIESIGPQRVIESIGPQRVIESIGPQRVIESMGPERLIESMGIDKFVDAVGLPELLDHLTPEQREELRRRLQAEPPAAARGEKNR